MSLARLSAGLIARDFGSEPAKPVELYEFEACPYCRRVREVLTEIDIGAVIYPCPKSGTRFRPKVVQRGGKSQFPYFVDPNTGTEIYESSDIIDHLYRHYGSGRPSVLVAKPLALATSSVASVFGGSRRGRMVRASRVPEKMLELYSFEASPFCRLAREALCELELPYRLHNLGKGSRGRGAFVERSGRMMVPYLVDPNTDVEMFESADIVRYLNDTYGA